MLTDVSINHSPYAHPSSSILSSSSGSCSSSSTVWGPGTLAGKALMTFGEAVLSRIDGLIIQRRLATLETLIPYRGNDKAGERIFDDLLELSRAGIYGEKIQQRALQMIQKQLQSSSARDFIKAIEKWPAVEIQAFINDYIDYCQTNLGSHVIFGLCICPTMYQCFHWNDSFDWMCQISQLNDEAYYHLLRLGFLNSVLCLCLDLSSEYRNARLTLANETLQGCAETPERQKAIAEHPLSALWPSDVPFFLRPSTIAEQIHNRQLTWRKMDHLFETRVGMICRLNLKTRNLSNAEILDIVIDLLEASDSLYYDPRISQDAYVTLEDLLETTNNAKYVYRICCDAISKDPHLGRELPLPMGYYPNDQPNHVPLLSIEPALLAPPGL